MRWEKERDPGFVGGEMADLPTQTLDLTLGMVSATSTLMSGPDAGAQKVTSPQ